MAGGLANGRMGLLWRTTPIRLFYGILWPRWPIISRNPQERKPWPVPNVYTSRWDLAPFSCCLQGQPPLSEARESFLCVQPLYGAARNANQRETWTLYRKAVLLKSWIPATTTTRLMPARINRFCQMTGSETLPVWKMTDSESVT
jgi:hypothetical protein